MMKAVRFGIVGCGTAGRFHAEALEYVEDAQLAGVFDTREEAASRFAGEHNADFWCTDYRQFLSRDDIDAVCICTPTGLHAAHATEAAEAGKHILIEKPVGLNLEEIDALDRTIRRTGVKLGVVLQWRTHDALKSVKKAIDEGQLGPIHMISVRLKYHRTQDYYDAGGWRGTWKHDGGGAVMNQGIHAIDTLLWLAGPVQSVYGQTRTATHRIETEDTAAAIVNFRNGALATIEAATSTYPGFPVRFEFHGEKGTVIFSENGVIQWENMDDSIPNPDPGADDAAHGASSPAAISRRGHVQLIRNLIEAIRFDREPLVSIDEARKSVELTLALYRSAQTGSQIEMSSFCNRAVNAIVG